MKPGTGTATSRSRRYPWLHRRGRGESGAVVVEFAIIAPLLFLLIMGMIDFGNIYSNQISIRQGVREAARQGVVENFGSSCTLNATDITPSSDMQSLMCTVKNRIGITPASNVYTKVMFDPTYTLNKGLIICAQMPAQSLSGFTTPFISGVFLKSKVEMNLEQVSATPETAGEETAPSGSDWNWCTPTGSTP